jgi:hypothetical protein
MRNKVLWILAAAFLNAGIAVVGRGSFSHTFAVLAAGIYIGFAALILAGCGYVFGQRFAWVRLIGRIALVVFVLTESLLISLIPGRLLANRDIAMAKTYCESLIPVIDRYRQEHGAYPLVLATVVQGGDVPHPLRRGRFYWSDGKTYSFDIGDPRGMMNNFVGYSNQTRRWSNWH